jgi:8-oxo-dGTP pyrophosphatase MutT (NUDIX family)
MAPAYSPLYETIAAVLRNRRPRAAEAAGFRRAAVLLPLFEASDGPALLLCRRTQSVPTHKGQIGFPGGGSQPADADLTATALREVEEEIGVRPADVAVLGVLDDTVAASSRHIVRPVVGVIPYPAQLRLDPFEIVETLSMPLLPLLRGAPFREETWEREGDPVSVLSYDHAGQIIWGLTARILKQFVDLVREPLGARGLLD